MRPLWSPDPTVAAYGKFFDVRSACRLYCFRSGWGAELYAHIRSVIETGRRCAIDALEAIRLTLAGKSLAQRVPS